MKTLMRFGVVHLVAIVLVGGYFLWQGIALPHFNTTTPSDNDPQLTVLPQDATDSVAIERVVLRDPGYVVIRGIEGSRLGQIIEISKYLPAGEHKDVTVSLGSFYESGQDLIAVLYKDTGDLQVFNDLDQPVFGSDGNMIARYVKDGTEVPTAAMQLASSGHAGMAMETVRYTDQGFVPAQLTVAVGTMVEFVNESSLQMWVASNEHPEHSQLPTFDQFSGTGKNGMYTYMFDKKGTWDYHDHNNPALEGAVTVN